MIQETYKFAISTVRLNQSNIEVDLLMKKQKQNMEIPKCSKKKDSLWITFSSYKTIIGVENMALNNQAMPMDILARRPKIENNWILILLYCFSNTTDYLHSHEPEKFIGRVMASYRSILNATKTYVDAYVTHAWINRTNLHATFPARHEIVIRQIISIRTLKIPTNRSVNINRIINVHMMSYLWLRGEPTYRQLLIVLWKNSCVIFYSYLMIKLLIPIYFPAQWSLTKPIAI